MYSTTIRITFLVDNISQQGLSAEHGFAVLIEQKKQRLLFDCGQGEALFHNADKLNIALNDLDAIILSHGHFDHGGNLKQLLLDNPNATLYLHPDCLQTRYSLHPNKEPRKISLPQSAIEAINQFPTKQKQFNKFVKQITDNIFITGQIPRVNKEEQISGPFYLDPLKQRQDKLLDDQSLWIETKEGIVVIAGCCHSGIINTLTHIKNKAAQQKFICLLGGLHLLNADQNRLDATIDYLNKVQLTSVYPAHCTGQEANKQLKKKIRSKVKNTYAGLTVII